MTAALNYCRICHKPRKGIAPAHKHCESCASPLTTAPVSEKIVKPKPPCPNCGSSISVETEPERFTCSGCRAVFERCETQYAGHRPLENCASKEEYELRRAGRRPRN